MAMLDYEPHPPGRRGEPLWWTNVKRSLAGAALLPVGLLTILLAVFAVGSIYETIITPIIRLRREACAHVWYVLGCAIPNP
jgi:hypothetical protein